MRGSIRRRGERSWEIRLCLGKNPTTGKWQQKCITVHGTRKDADRELTKYLRQLDTGSYVDPERITVAEFLERWLKDYLEASGRAAWTQRSYTSIVRKHLIPALGYVQLQRLTPAMVQGYYATKRKAGSIGNAWMAAGQPLSATTVAHHHAVLHEALEHAMRWGLVARNVTDAADPPKIAKKDVQVWSADQVRRFLGATKGTRFHGLFLAAITTGMRQGELLGLRWQDVDLDAGIATVRQTLHKAGANPVFGRPKTERSRRRIVLLPELVTALRLLQVEQSAERLEAVDQYRDYGLVFTVPGGAPISQSNLRRRVFDPLTAKAQVPRIRFHDLRHSHATLLLKNGEHPKVVSERLGHASVTTTLEVYSHVMPDMQQDAAARLQASLFAAV